MPKYCVRFCKTSKYMIFLEFTLLPYFRFTRHLFSSHWMSEFTRKIGFESIQSWYWSGWRMCPKNLAVLEELYYYLPQNITSWKDQAHQVLRMKVYRAGGQGPLPLVTLLEPIGSPRLYNTTHLPSHEVMYARMRGKMKYRAKFNRLRLSGSTHCRSK